VKTHVRPSRCAAIAVLAAASAVDAGLPTYTFELQARTNFAVNPGGTFNVPPGYFFSNADIQVNDSRQVSFRLGATPGLFQSVWFGQNGLGGIAYNSPDDAFISETALNNNGRVIWPMTFVATPGIYFYDHPSAASGFLTSRPLGTSTWGSPNINDAGQVGFRAGFNGPQAFVSWDPGTNTVAEHAIEQSIDPQSPYTFLFTPSFNNARQIGAKVQLSGNRNQVRIFNADGSSVLIAQDRNSNPASPYTGFDNSVWLTNDGKVAFIANLFPSGRGVFLSDGTTTATIATQGQGGVGNIEFFGPSANNAGLVTFRAFNSAGLRAIWVGDGTTLTPLVTEHDILPSDLGPARVDQETPSSPVFGGKPEINASGDIAFNCGLAPPDNDQIEWGSAVYVAIASVPPPTCPGDANGDGQINGADLSVLLSNFGQPAAGPAFGDFNGDGVCNGADLSVLLAQFGNSCP